MGVLRGAKAHPGTNAVTAQGPPDRLQQRVIADVTGHLAWLTAGAVHELQRHRLYRRCRVDRCLQPVRKREKGIGSHDAATRQRCIEAGMNAYISKPIDFPACLRLIGETIARTGAAA